VNRMDININRLRVRLANRSFGEDAGRYISCAQGTFARRCSLPRMTDGARRGVVLMLVLVVVAIATTLAYSFVSSQATTVSITRNVENQTQARYIAESGLAIAFSYVRNTDTWRDDQSNSAWVAGASFGGGTYSIRGEDGADSDGDNVISTPTEGDGDLDDDPADQLTITVTASYDSATHTVRAVLTPQAVSDIRVLLITPNDGNLTAQDAAKKAIMENWGFTVTAISANALQAEYDAAIADADVAYVTEDVVSSDVGTKLNNASIGVVVEENALNDDMNYSTSAEWYFGYSQINITDNTHYITETFATGSLTITTATTELGARTGTLAPGLVTLATRTANANSALDYVDVGGALNGGGTAPGRRVFLPWGGASFDVGLLTTDGKSIMKRAIEWSVGDAPLSHWRFDELTGTLASDSGSGGYHGTLTNMSPPSNWVIGQVSGALEFDGNNDYVDLTGFPNLTGSFTITAWIRPDVVINDQRIFADDQNGAGGYGFSLGDGGSGRLRFFSRGINPIILDSTPVVTTSNWQFVAAVHDAAAKRRYLYRGASLVGSDGSAYSGSWGADSGPASIGGEVDGTSESTARWRFDGRIDDVRVYDKALTAEQIGNLYGGGGGASTKYVYNTDWLD